MNTVKIPKNKENPVYKINALLTKHFSFLVLLAGSGVYYLFNLLLKYILTEEQYGEYGLFHSFISIALTFAVVGGDQLLMRLAKLDNGSVIIPPKVLYLNICLLIVFSATAPFGFNYFTGLSFSYWSLFICSLLSGINILLFSVLRLKGAFTLAQVQKNGWKIALFLFTILFLVLGFELSVQSIIYLNIFSIALTILFSIIGKNKLNLSFKDYFGMDFRLWSSFAVSMLVMNLLSYADRFLIDLEIGRAEVGHYFFLQNLFLFPLIQLQTYSGFRELVSFKKDYNNSLLKTSLKRNILLGLATSILIISVTGILNWAIKDLGILWGRDWPIILLIILIGLSRVCYAVLSAAMGAIGTTRQIRATNIFTIIVSIALFLMFNELGFTLIGIALFIFLVWIGRGFIYYFVLDKVKAE